MSRRGTFDYILLETTGLADPGNIAPLFWMDEGLGSSIYLDGVVTMVDARNVERTLDDPVTAGDVGVHHQEGEDLAEGARNGRTGHYTTAHLQISHADIVMVNKADTLVNPSRDLERIKARISSINGLAKIIVTQYGRVPQLEGTVLDLHAYEGVSEVDFGEKGHSHLDSVSLSCLVLISYIPPEKGD